MSVANLIHSLSNYLPLLFSKVGATPRSKINIFAALIVSVSVLTSPKTVVAAEDLSGACERAVSCYANLACRPTIPKDLLSEIDSAKCYLDEKCAASLDSAKLAKLSNLKSEFPANDSSTAFYERNVKSQESQEKRLPAGY